MGEGAGLGDVLPVATGSAVAANHVAVPFGAASTNGEGDAFRAGAAGLADGVVIWIAGLRLVLIWPADTAVVTCEVRGRIRSARANPVLFPKLAFGAPLASDISGSSAW